MRIYSPLSLGINRPIRCPTTTTPTHPAAVQRTRKFKLNSRRVLTCYIDAMQPEQRDNQDAGKQAGRMAGREAHKYIEIKNNRPNFQPFELISPKFNYRPALTISLGPLSAPPPSTAVRLTNCKGKAFTCRFIRSGHPALRIKGFPRSPIALLIISHCLLPHF